MDDDEDKEGAESEEKVDDDAASLLPSFIKSASSLRANRSACGADAAAPIARSAGDSDDDEEDEDESDDDSADCDDEPTRAGEAGPPAPKRSARAAAPAWCGSGKRAINHCTKRMALRPNGCAGIVRMRSRWARTALCLDTAAAARNSCR